MTTPALWATPCAPTSAIRFIMPQVRALLGGQSQTVEGFTKERHYIVYTAFTKETERLAQMRVQFRSKGFPVGVSRANEQAVAREGRDKFKSGKSA